jgi:hypothetical protein
VPRASGDRIAARPRGITCPQREWPYFAAACLRDPKRPFGGAGRVRIVSIDRLPLPPTDPKPAHVAAAGGLPQRGCRTRWPLRGCGPP